MILQNRDKPCCDLAFGTTGKNREICQVWNIVINLLGFNIVSYGNLDGTLSNITSAFKIKTDEVVLLIKTTLKQKLWILLVITIIYHMQAIHYC